MSKSVRSLVTHSATTFLTNFVHGEWTDKPHGLPSGARLAHKIIEKVMRGNMKPIGVHLIFNTDDCGRIAIEGVILATSGSKRNRIGKVAKAAVMKDARRISTIWRRQKTHEIVHKGVKCEFKILVAASGHILQTFLPIFILRTPIKGPKRKVQGEETSSNFAKSQAFASRKV
jgi:hypothetical protein